VPLELHTLVAQQGSVLLHGAPGGWQPPPVLPPDVPEAPPPSQVTHIPESTSQQVVPGQGVALGSPQATQAVAVALHTGAEAEHGIVNCPLHVPAEEQLHCVRLSGDVVVVQVLAQTLG